MTIVEFDTEEELDEEAEYIEEINFKYAELVQAIVDAEKSLEDAKNELEYFRDDNCEILSL